MCDRYDSSMSVSYFLILAPNVPTMQLDQKDFFRPVITPYELYIALSDQEWVGKCETDFARVLPGLRDALSVERERER